MGPILILKNWMAEPRAVLSMCFVTTGFWAFPVTISMVPPPPPVWTTNPPPSPAPPPPTPFKHSPKAQCVTHPWAIGGLFGR